ncbi:endolytic transglycosylase MltG [Alteribacter natronophilus]|uniref:endolytic transglycosylase MltG n=1 Tax=Alteribacter natronophilus TaxID=2583810 RepID=UPI00110E60B6|nr:endolytic transglycosylase MltG [Alteribacter natronophilus]TMW73807.1 endolytic transglycosylase MltG [Alteribacter natronophilus]
MVTKTGLRAGAAGIFMTTSVFAVLHYTGSTAESAGEGEGAADRSVTIEEALSVLEGNEDYRILHAEDEEAAETDSEALAEKEAEIDSLRSEVDSLTSELEELAQENGDSEVIYQTTLVVGSGMTFGSIAGILERAQVIDDRGAFNDYVSDNGLEMSLRQGEFVFDSSMSIAEIVDELTS